MHHLWSAGKAMRPTTGVRRVRKAPTTRTADSFSLFEVAFASSFFSNCGQSLFHFVEELASRLLVMVRTHSIAIRGRSFRKWIGTHLRKSVSSLALWGLDLRKVHRAVMNLGRVRSDRRRFTRQLALQPDASAWVMGPAYPIFGEQDDEAGQASGHYFHQDLFVAQLIFQRAPRRHIDVGSSIYGFVSHVASFRDIEVIDIRPVVSECSGITFHCLDLMQLPGEWHGAADSVSCLHVLEHIGLGRYGDDIAADGWLRGLHSLHALLEENGTLHLAVPIGEVQRIEFNAHRVFSLPYLRGHLLDYFEIENLAFVDDHGSLIRNIDPFGQEADSSMKAIHGLSIWTLRKKNESGPLV